MYRAVQHRSKLLFSTRSFVLISLILEQNILMKFLELNNDFEYFIHVGRVLQREAEGAVAPSHISMF